MATHYPTTYGISANGSSSGYTGAKYVNPSERISGNPPYSTYWSISLDELAEQLAPVHVTPIDPVTEQVFGAQLRRTQYSLEQSTELLNERAALYRQHLRDIDHRRMQIQEELFGARLHAREDGHRRALRLQQTLLQLEGDRRQEALAFWKDATDLRKSSLEHSGEYDALRHRVRMLAPAGVEEFPYG